MKIVMLCLTGHYMPGWGYQENFMVKACIENGVDVSVIANDILIDSKTQKLVKTDIGVSYEDKCKIIRLKMKNYGKLSNKLRHFYGLMNALIDEKPDILFIHGMQFGDITIVGEYAKTHKECYIIADNHADYGNSALNFLSKTFLHNIYYKNKIKKVEKYINKFYYVAIESKDFLAEHYGIKDRVYQLFLGGNCLSDEDYSSQRSKIRKELNICNDQIMCVHGGKMTKQKMTLETLEAFDEISKIDNRFVLFVLGSFSKDINIQAENIINNNANIVYAGWKTANEFDKYLIACDLFIQIGTSSSIFQQAICDRAVCVLCSRENNKCLLSNDNGFIVDTKKELIDVLKDISNNSITLEKMQQNANDYALKNLDYKIQIQSIINEYKKYLENIEG